MGSFPGVSRCPREPSELGRASLCPLGEPCAHFIEGAAPYPHVPCPVSALTPWNALSLRPRVPRTHAGCFLPLGPRPGHRCGGGHPSVSRGTSPGLGAHLLLDPRLVDATERGRMHVSPGASRLQVGMTFQAEYQPQGEKRDGQKGSWASPWGNPPPMLAALISP